MQTEVQHIVKRHAKRSANTQNKPQQAHRRNTSTRNNKKNNQEDKLREDQPRFFVFLSSLTHARTHAPSHTNKGDRHTPFSMTRPTYSSMKIYPNRCIYHIYKAKFQLLSREKTQGITQLAGVLSPEHRTVPLEEHRTLQRSARLGPEKFGGRVTHALPAHLQQLLGGKVRLA